MRYVGHMPCTAAFGYCVDCGKPFDSYVRLRKRCEECQRLRVNAATTLRDKQRRERQKAERLLSKALGLPYFKLLRDNGHRCRCCGVVLFCDGGMPPRSCHQCKEHIQAIDTICDVLSLIVSVALPGGPECLVCGVGLPSGCDKTCSRECRTEWNRRKTRLRYELATGVKLRPATGPRSCRFCDRVIHPDHGLGRGRDVCDYCNLHRGSFKARAMLYGVAYEHVSRVGVFRRDGWKCQLCGRSVIRRSKRNKRTRRLHPRTASLDHIVPMRRGGPHVESNCQCACLRCNVRKHAKLIGQRRLF